MAGAAGSLASYSVGGAGKAGLRREAVLVSCEAGEVVESLTWCRSILPEAECVPDAGPTAYFGIGQRGGGGHVARVTFVTTPNSLERALLAPTSANELVVCLTAAEARALRGRGHKVVAREEVCQDVVLMVESMEGQGVKKVEEEVSEACRWSRIV